MSPFGAKIVFFSLRDFPHPFVQQVGRAGSLSKTLKDAASGKIFDLMNDFGETEMPKGQRICKVLVLREGKLSVHLELDYLVRIPDKYSFICESVEDLLCWCYPDILSLLFQYASRNAIDPKNHAVNHIHILALSLI